MNPIPANPFTINQTLTIDGANFTVTALMDGGKMVRVHQQHWHLICNECNHDQEILSNPVPDECQECGSGDVKLDKAYEIYAYPLLMAMTGMWSMTECNAILEQWNLTTIGEASI
jgi:hypothetical protein